MLTTVAPRPRTRSTVRLVSVVVPDCEMAMTRSSLMSSSSPKPDNSVAGSAVTIKRVSFGNAVLRAAARLCPAMAAVP